MSRTDLGLLVLRVGLGACMIGFHGWTRLHRAVDYAAFNQPWTFVDVVHRLGFPFPGVFAVLSALSESVGALLVIAGLFARPAAAILGLNMAVALVNELGKGDPIELPALYLLGAAAIVLLGPGAFSLDRWRRRS